MLMEATQIHELLTNSFMKKNWNERVKFFSQLYHWFWIKINIMFITYLWIHPFDDWLFPIKHSFFQNSSPWWYCFPPFWWISQLFAHEFFLTTFRWRLWCCFWSLLFFQQFSFHIEAIMCH
jgi:hypothetical protein